MTDATTSSAGSRATAAPERRSIDRAASTARPAAPRPPVVAHREARSGRPEAAPPPAIDTQVARLRRAGLRPTRQRVDLARVLFGAGDRHVSAETVYEEALALGATVSLATVYNTLKQFTQAGLLRELAVSGAKSFFDTRVDHHHHFYVEGAGTMADVEADTVVVSGLPTPPDGLRIVGWDVVIRLAPIDDV